MAFVYSSIRSAKRSATFARRWPWRWFGMVVVLSGVLAMPLAAQQDPTSTPELVSTAVAKLMLEGQPAGRVAVSQGVVGPSFALAPIAAALGVELRTGPLGDSHTLILEDRRIIFGPNQAVMLTVAPDGKTQREITRLGQLPFRDGAGLKVSLEALEKALGEPLSYRFIWLPSELELQISRPELRVLEGSINVVNQYQESVVGIEFSDKPRYRVERSPGVLVIRLLGDRLALPVKQPRVADALITAIRVSEDRVRFELADHADADEPRLQLTPKPRLVIEVFEKQNSARRVDNPSRQSASQVAGIRTIALDPGHGGPETGAIGPGGNAEKDLNLLVARALRLQLERRLRVKVVMTRTEDVDVPLETRAAIANEARADLFISLHLNSSFGATAHGAETFFLSREASDKISADIAAQENKFSSGTDDPELDLRMILWDLAQSYHLAESQRFATLVQEELNLTLGLRDRGVKQAPFHVLMGAKMPAVLVELGFLSNPEEESKLQTPAYRAELVDALVRAITRFKKQLEGGSTIEIDTAGASSGGDITGSQEASQTRTPR